MNAQRSLIASIVARHAKDFRTFSGSSVAPRLKQFQRESFGASSRQQDDDFATWLYLDRPQNELIYCEKAGRVVGTQGAIGFPLEVSGESLRAACAIDLRVRPEWKMKGVGVALIGSLLGKYDVVLGLGISDEAESMFLRQGWLDLGYTDRFVKPITFGGFLSYGGQIPAPLLRVLNACVRWFLGAVDAVVVKQTPSPNTRVSRIERFLPEYDAVLEKYGSGRNQLPRTSDYLNWRYFTGPVAGRYRVYGVFDDDTFDGYMAIAIGLRDGKSVLAISDIHCSDIKVTNLLKVAIAEARKAGVDAIYYQGINPSLNRVLKQHLFIERARGSRFMVFAPKDDLRAALGKRENWRIALSDSDMDFSIVYTGPKATRPRPQSRELEVGEDTIEPFYFGEPGRRLLGIYHPPAGVARQEGIVICPPLFAEYLRSHACLRRFAIMASRLGFSVLRFDYYGTGDSEGEFERTTPDDWIADIGVALRELEAIAGVTRIGLMGVRLGATLAARVAADLDSITRLLLWDPVVDGAAYLNDLRATHRMLIETHESARFHLGEAREELETDPREFVGSPVSSDLVRELSQLKFPDWDRVLAREGIATTLAISRENFGSEAMLADAHARDVRIEHVDFDCNWSTHTVAVLYPQSIISALLSEI